MGQFEWKCRHLFSINPKATYIDNTAERIKRIVINVWKALQRKTLEFFLNVFTEFSDTKLLSLKGLEPATSCGGDQYATTVPARPMWEAGSLNWAQFMPQWFVGFPEFAKFNESSDPLRKNSIGRVNIQSTLAWFTMSAKRMTLTILEACGYINSKKGISSSHLFYLSASQ